MNIFVYVFSIYKYEYTGMNFSIISCRRKIMVSETNITKPHWCEGPDSWAWKCQGQSACSLHDQSPALPASLVAPLSFVLPSSWSPQPCTGVEEGKLLNMWRMGLTRGKLFIYTKSFDTHFLDFSSFRTLASALALFSSLLASESWSLLASI